MSAPSSDPEGGPNRAIFSYPANQKTKLLKEDLGPDGHHAELECQRFARQSLLENDVLLHQNAVELCTGCKLKRPRPRSAPQARASKSGIRSSALAPTVPPSAPRNAHGACVNDGMKRRSWALRQPAQGCEYRAAGTPPPVGSRHRNIERRQSLRGVDNLHHGAPLIPLLGPDLEEPVRPCSPEFFPRRARRTRCPRPHSPSGSAERCSWPPPWQSSGSVERCTSRAQHHGCDEGLLPGPSAA